MPSCHEWKQGLGALLLNFSTPLVFFAAFHEWGPKAAIGFAVFATSLQLASHWLYRVKPSPFFMIASGFTVLFGGVDLLIRAPQFYRFEPFAQNFVVATLLGITTLSKIPLAFEIVRALPKPLRPTMTGPDDPELTRLTWTWTLYLYLKAGGYLYLAFHVDLGDLILVKTVVGSASLVLMGLGELLYQKYRARHASTLNSPPKSHTKKHL
jgi:intracellular septation protein A